MDAGGVGNSVAVNGLEGGSFQEMGDSLDAILGEYNEEWRNLIQELDENTKIMDWAGRLQEPLANIADKYEDGVAVDDLTASERGTLEDSYDLIAEQANNPDRVGFEGDDGSSSRSRYDLDGDGEVTPEEVQQYYEGDGELTHDELEEIEQRVDNIHSSASSIDQRLLTDIQNINGNINNLHLLDSALVAAELSVEKTIIDKALSKI